MRLVNRMQDIPGRRIYATSTSSLRSDRHGEPARPYGNYIQGIKAFRRRNSMVPETYEIWKRLFLIWKLPPQIWKRLFLIWKSLPQIWKRLFLIWKSLPQIWKRLFLIWKSLPQIWKRLFLIWKSLPQIWKRLFLIWISLFQIRKSHLLIWISVSSSRAVTCWDVYPFVCKPPVHSIFPKNISAG